MALDKKYTKERHLIVGINDLETWCNDNKELGDVIKREWDEDKNGSMKNYKPGSGKEVWFICSECGQSYKKILRNRVNGGKHKPCAKEQAKKRIRQYFKSKITEEKSLVKQYPDLMREWDYEKNSDINPEYISINSSKKVYWKCEHCGESFQGYIRCRTLRKTGCPSCRREEQKRNENR